MPWKKLEILSHAIDLCWLKSFGEVKPNDRLDNINRFIPDIIFLELRIITRSNAPEVDLIGQLSSLILSFKVVIWLDRRC